MWDITQISRSLHENAAPHSMLSQKASMVQGAGSRVSSPLRMETVRHWFHSIVACGASWVQGYGTKNGSVLCTKWSSNSWQTVVNMRRTVNFFRRIRAKPSSNSCQTVVWIERIVNFFRRICAKRSWKSCQTVAGRDWETSTVAWSDRIDFFSISWHIESRRILIHPRFMQKSRHFHVLPAFGKIIFVISSRSANRTFKVLPLEQGHDCTIFDGTTNHSMCQFDRWFPGYRAIDERKRYRLWTAGLLLEFFSHWIEKCYRPQDGRDRFSGRPQPQGHRKWLFETKRNLLLKERAWRTISCIAEDNQGICGDQSSFEWERDNFSVLEFRYRYILDMTFISIKLGDFDIDNKGLDRNMDLYWYKYPISK
jgi:hypothetical protein